MGFCWATIHVSNLDESVRFYRDIVGLTVNRRYTSGPYVEIAFMGEGQTLVELLYNSQETEHHIGDSISLGFTVESLEKKMNELAQRHVSIFSGPFWPNPTIGFFYVLDPDGTMVQFVENKG